MYFEQMRYLLCFLLLCPMALLAQITFKVQDAAGEPIRVMQPLNGKYHISAWRDDTLNTSGELTLPSQPGTHEFLYKQKIYRLYVQPGKAYTLTLNKEDIKIQAPDETGQLALNRLSLPFYQSAAMEYYKADTVFGHNKAKVLAAMEQQLQPFKGMDKGLYRYAEKLVKVYYANLLAGTFMMPMMKLDFNKDKAKIKEIAAYWEDVFAIADPRDPACMAVNPYFDYANFCNTWYFTYFLPGSKGAYKPQTQDDEYWTRKYDAIQSYYKEPLKEYLTAQWIYAIAMEKGFQPFAVDWLRDFNKAYPRSIYTPYLTPGINTIKDYLAKIKKDFSATQEFIKDSVNSFEELAARFKGKTVYMDLWATWCGPCKAEFAYNKGLKEFLQKNGTQVLYISIDKDAADQQWKDMIRYYDLQGYHIRASAKLVQDIRRIFGNSRGSLTIPRYAIIKDGKLVENDAKRPSDKKALYRQIEDYL